MIKKLAIYLAAFLIATWFMTPFVLITLAALTPPREFYKWPRPIIPSRFTLETLRRFVFSYKVLESTLNSIIVALMTIGLSFAIGLPTGYALARFAFRGKDLLKLIILTTRMFPIMVAAIPLAVLSIKLGIYDTLIGVAFVHTAMALPFVVLITSNIFASIPKDFEEAAMTLGASRAMAFLRITLPLASPALAASAIFTFVISWNEVFAAAILTTLNRTLPAQVLVSLDVSPMYFKFAGGFFMTIPALIFILITRKYLLTMWGIQLR